jgi:hypothetical protein
MAVKWIFARQAAGGAFLEHPLIFVDEEDKPLFPDGWRGDG